jgi:hypothetical protein
METKRVINLYDSEKNNDLFRCIEFSKFCLFAEKIHRFQINYVTNEDCYLLTITYECSGKVRNFYCKYHDNASLLFQDIKILESFIKEWEE